MSAPVSAAKYLITVQGTAFAFAGAPGSTPIAEVAALGGAAVFAAFEVDSSLATFTPGSPAGGFGTTGLWTGSVQQGAIGIGGVALVRNGNDFGNIFLVDNGGAGPSNPNGRLDQATISSSARVPGFLTTTYDILGLPGDIFLNSLAFGRTRVGDINNLPTLVTDVTQRPDFPSFLLNPGGTNPFMSMQFRRGNPTAQTQIAALPVHSISVTNLQFFVEEITGVPEPSSWAMLIIGFGLTGATLRRRRALAAA
ncbi:PEPxxWA-CTERM sorting domain-containing protein [Sandarakinorhabdus sp. AAP62]|uniref:PEPxxWA-CTERM sorting domain-containing protein n=1 Tax=Sandarakinorhabdus sp. AAP62 TaxID=1248916 RepID=UPI00030C6765|nr:PEPxxWA-CTERM sorting domain-containing protein [Sandarakinorhabdus sp. AAP62]